MKKAAFFVLMLFTYYLAGMYRSLPLMALCVGEFLFFVYLFVLPRYFRSRLSVAFSETLKHAEEGTDTLFHINIQNRSRLPVSRLELRLRTRYLQETKYAKTKLYGGAQSGENSFEIHFLGQFCGLAMVRIDRLRVFDYLVLFEAEKRLDGEMKVAVFPKVQALHIELSDFDWGQDRQLEEWAINRQGEDHNEIRQIREYRSGDSKRHIHWNQSAKTDNLWIKEYERRTELRINILIDSTGFARASVVKLSAFYKLLDALVRGLLKEGAAVQVHWYHGGRDGFVGIDTADAGQLQDMLLLLYQTDFSQEDESSMKAILEQNMTYDPCFLTLTLELALFKGKAQICQFSPEKLDSEIQETVLTL